MGRLACFGQALKPADILNVRVIRRDQLRLRASRAIEALLTIGRECLELRGARRPPFLLQLMAAHPEEAAKLLRAEECGAIRWQGALVQDVWMTASGKRFRWGARRRLLATAAAVRGDLPVQRAPRSLPAGACLALGSAPLA